MAMQNIADVSQLANSPDKHLREAVACLSSQRAALGVGRNLLLKCLKIRSLPSKPLLRRLPLSFPSSPRSFLPIMTLVCFAPA